MCLHAYVHLALPLAYPDQGKFVFHWNLINIKRKFTSIRKAQSQTDWPLKKLIVRSDRQPPFKSSLFLVQRN